MIIDAHNHADWHDHDFDAFIANMDKCGIDRTWILSWESPLDEYDPNTGSVLPIPMAEGARGPIPFALGLEYKRKAPSRFVLGYAPDPRRPDAVEKLKAAVSIYGVQVCGELKLRMMYDSPDALRMYRYCGEAGLPVILHFDYAEATKTGRTYPRPDYWYGGDIYTLEKMLIACPETNFLGHAPGFWCHISDDELGKTTAYPQAPVVRGGMIERLLEKYPNLYCDCSAGSGHNALSRDKAYTRELILRYPDRFLYARDYFDNIHRELFESLDLPEDVKKLLYQGNAERLAGPEKVSQYD